MRITPSVEALYIGEEQVMHPGGTNLYLVGDSELALIDTGDFGTVASKIVLEYLASRPEARLREILITHGHHDHIGGVEPIRAATGASARAHPYLAAEPLQASGALPLQDGEVVHVGRCEIEAVYTPGHSVAHICYFLRGERVLFSGDTILGSSTSTVKDLGSYMASLQRLQQYDVATICPGHGPIITDARERIRGYIAHRQMRERQVLEALAKGPQTSRSLTLEIYADVDPRLHRAAEGNVLTHLAKLQAEGRVEASSEEPPRYKLT